MNKLLDEHQKVFLCLAGMSRPRAEDLKIRAKCVSLHNEIENFCAYILPTPTEHAVRMQVVSRIEDVVLGIWPNARVEVFGSFQTGLYLPTSDIDLLVLGNWEKLPLQTLKEELTFHQVAEPSSIRVLDNAMVPIIKLVDRESQVKVDISFNTEPSIQAAELVKYFKSTYPVLTPLTLVLKQFLLQRDLNDVFTGGVSSYSLILMCVSFLQLHVRNNFENANLGVLLIEFMELYGKRFNYMQTGINVMNGGRYYRKCDFGSNNCKGYQHWLLSIDDPITHGNDVSRGSYGILKVKQAFEYAYTVLTKAVNGAAAGAMTSNGSILGRVIQVPDEVVKYRKWIKGTFESKLIRNKSNNGFKTEPR